MTVEALRARRMERRRAEAESRREMVCGLLALLLMLAVYAFAGTMDYYDRTHGCGVSMVPSAEWWDEAS